MEIIKWIVARLKERSTWIGVAGLLTAVGVTLEPALKEAIIGAGVAVASAVAIATKDA